MPDSEIVIGFDPKTEKDEACLVVINRGYGGALFGHANVLKTFYGKEAEDLYLKLIGGDEDGEP